MIVETQGTINTWATCVFGEGTPEAMAARAAQEFTEFLEAVKADPTAKLPSTRAEVADVAILLYRFAAVAGFHLPAEVDQKMAVNRKRKWVSAGDGTGQHVE